MMPMNATSGNTARRTDRSFKPGPLISQTVDAVGYGIPKLLDLALESRHGNDRDDHKYPHQDRVLRGSLAAAVTQAAYRT